MITSLKKFIINEQLINKKWYHGSKVKFENFTLNTSISNNTYGSGIGDHNLGIFLTDNLTMSKWFAGIIEFNDYQYENTGNGGYVYECTPLIKNPFILNEQLTDIDEDDAGQTYFEFINKFNSIHELRNMLLNNNYDSLIVNDVTTNYYENGSYSILIILDTKNIKINKIENYK